jgi:nardilysin
VSSLIKAKKTADVTLEEEVHRNWNEILSGEYLFDRHAREIQLLEGCQKEAMVKYMNAFLKRSDSRRKLSVQVVGNANAFKDDDVCNGDDASNDVEGSFELQYFGQNGDKALPINVVVTDVNAFKTSLTTFPILHIIE